MKRLKTMVAFAMALLMLVPASLFASSHREAPITALDHSADVTDWYAFVSYDHPDRVTMILNVDPFLEPSNGPNYFPFDPNVLYEMKIDNNRDGMEDITFQFRFKTEIRLPDVFTGFVGGIAGIPPITALDGPGSEGLEPAAALHRHHGEERRAHRPDRRADAVTPCLPTSARAPCRTTTPCSSRESTTWATAYACSPERSTIRSTSTWARPSTRSTSAWESAEC